MLKVTPQASTEEIRQAAKMRIQEIQNTYLSKDEKKHKISNIVNAFKILSEYHSRREYDDKIVLQPMNISNIGKNYNNLMTPVLGSSIFPNMNISSFDQHFQKMNNMMKNMNTVNNSYSSYSKGYLDKNNNWIVNQKDISNNNGKINTKNTVTITKQDGTIKKINIPLNKK